MRISEMLKRENFYSIFEKTLIVYYHEVKGVDINFSYKRRQGQKLIINSKLGFISSYPAPDGLRTFLLSEYNIRGNIIKYCMGKAVVLVISRFPQIGEIRNCYIDDNILGENTFIYPQNRSIRFFDYDSMTVDCIIKQGFTETFFQNQMNFRSNTDYDFLVPVLKKGKIWFREPILLGHPLARITDERIYNNSIEKAIRNIRRLAEDTYQEEPIESYTEKLLSKIAEKVEIARGYKNICYADQTMRVALDAVNVIRKHKMMVPLCMSHGDFQTGNIWVDSMEKVWIYDWETVGIRSIWYDCSVLLYSLRRNYGWMELIKDDRPLRMIRCDKIDQRPTSDYEAMKCIVLLEDILFYLEDMLELPGDWGNNIYDNYMKNISKLFLNKP